MTRQTKIEILHFITEVKPFIKDDRILDRAESIRQNLLGNINYFDITAVHRDDLVFSGFVGTLATDEQLERLASKMADDYCEQLFHTSLDIIAEHLKIPKWHQVRDRLTGFCEDLLESTFDGDERSRINWANMVLNSLGDAVDYKAPQDEQTLKECNKALDYIHRSLSEYNDKSVLTDYEPLVEGLRSFVNAQIY